MIFCIISTIVTIRSSLVKCPACRGTGCIRHRSYCSGCLGTGNRITEISERVGVTCNRCGGSGRDIGPHGNICLGCGGRGTSEKIIMHRDIHQCLDCHGEPVATWDTECQLCDGDGRITIELRRRIRRRRFVRAVVKLAVILILIFVALCALVYFNKRL